MTIKIDKGIPIPKQKHRTKFPIGDLEIGDSFCVELPRDPEGEKKMRNSVAGRVQYYQNTLAIRCATRTVKEKGILKIRIWRTE